MAARALIYLKSSCRRNSMTISFSGWIWSIFRRRHINGVGLMLPPYTPPQYRNSIPFQWNICLRLFYFVCECERRRIMHSLYELPWFYLVDDEFCCDCKAFLLPVFALIDSRSNNLLHEILWICAMHCVGVLHCPIRHHSSPIVTFRDSHWNISYISLLTKTIIQMIYWSFVIIYAFSGNRC